MTACCSVLGLIFLVLTNLAIIIAFATPYWIDFSTFGVNQGLWALCINEKCSWVFEDNYDLFTGGGLIKINVNEPWWIAVQGLAAGGLAMALFSLLLATIALCCDCRSCNTSHAIAGMLLFSFLSLGVAAAVFGVIANKDYNVGLEKTLLIGRKFGWSFWLDVAAACQALFTSFIYMIEGRNKLA